MPDPVEHQRGDDDDASELQDGDLVPGLSHAAQARRAALQRAGEGREGFVLERPYVRSATVVGGDEWAEGRRYGLEEGWRVEGGGWKGEESTYGIVDDVLVPRVVVDVDRHAP